MSSMVTDISTPRGNVPVTPRRDYSRWRAATLIGVYVLFAVHIMHWKLAGKTLAPLELNEVMYTFEFGIVTAGFLFMVVITLGTMIFGRAFCSWGCHILALQDLCAWILRRFHIKPKAVRSRVLLWVPLAAALYMFVWPQVTRLYEGKPLPALHLRTDAQGWASFATENFWRNLPTLPITILTFAVCGFLAVYVLGSRAFCTYGCPYGAVFRLADRLAPARIRLKKDADCLACGACTAACNSHVRVHEELHRFGTVVNPACLRDLDCVAACPQGNVFYGFGLPSLLTPVRRQPLPGEPVVSATAARAPGCCGGQSAWPWRESDVPVRKSYDFTGREEILIAAVFLFVLCTYRGLYDRIPFLLSLAIAAIGAYLAIVFTRLWSRPDLQFNRWQLRIGGTWTLVGWTFISMFVLFALLTTHSSFVHYHAFVGHRAAAVALAGNPVDATQLDGAREHLQMSSRLGLMPVPRLQTTLAELHYQRAGIAFKSNQAKDAERHLLAALQADEMHYKAHYDLGALLLGQEDKTAGIAHLRRATELKPDFADGHYNLGVALWMAGSREEARHEVDRALQLNPGDPQTKQLRQLMDGAIAP